MHGSLFAALLTCMRFIFPGKKPGGAHAGVVRGGLGAPPPLLACPPAGTWLLGYWTVWEEARTGSVAPVQESITAPGAAAPEREGAGSAPAAGPVRVEGERPETLTEGGPGWAERAGHPVWTCLPWGWGAALATRCPLLGPGPSPTFPSRGLSQSPAICAQQPWQSLPPTCPPACLSVWEPLWGARTYILSLWSSDHKLCREEAVGGRRPAPRGRSL